jgi:hypothetical protein
MHTIPEHAFGAYPFAFGKEFPKDFLTVAVDPKIL